MRSTVLLFLAGCGVEYQPECAAVLLDAEDSVRCSGLCINEFMANNIDTWLLDPDDEGEEAYPDWIELYNGGGPIADTSAYTLVRDDSPFEITSVLPEGSLESGECLLIIADGRSDQSEPDIPHVGFNLNKEYGGIRLQKTRGPGCLVDRVWYDDQARGVSWQRQPTDGGEDWASQVAATPCGMN